MDSETGRAQALPVSLQDEIFRDREELSIKRDRVGIKKKLKAYAAAAAGALAVAPQAEAVIHYSGPQNIVVNSGNPSQVLDLNGDAVNDFRVKFNSAGTPNSFFNSHYINGLTAGNSVIDDSGPGFPLAANLPANYSIKNTLAPGRYWNSVGLLDSYSFYTSYDSDAEQTYTYRYSSGNFVGRTGYIGVRFNIPGNPCNPVYGWIQYEAAADAGTGTILDWAYEDNCGPIAAGATESPAPTPVPTVNEWGMLGLTGFLSAAAIKALRKKKREEE